MAWVSMIGGECVDVCMYNRIKVRPPNNLTYSTLLQFLFGMPKVFTISGSFKQPGKGAQMPG
jgi:hypothetical protein